MGKQLLVVLDRRVDMSKMGKRKNAPVSGHVPSRSCRPPRAKSLDLCAYSADYSRHSPPCCVDRSDLPPNKSGSQNKYHNRQDIALTILEMDRSEGPNQVRKAMTNSVPELNASLTIEIQASDPNLRPLHGFTALSCRGRFFSAFEKTFIQLRHHLTRVDASLRSFVIFASLRSWSDFSLVQCSLCVNRC